MASRVYENPKTNQRKKVNELVVFALAAAIGPLWWFFNGLFLHGLALMFLGAVIIASTGELYYAFTLQTSFGLLAINAIHEKHINKGWVEKETESA